MARKLRADGLSVREIEQHLGVARSSVSLWVRDVELTHAPRQAAIWNVPRDGL
jgi:transposase